jgi:protein ImuB
MHLLFSLYLPLLPLEALRPCWSEPGPFVVMQDGQAVVVSPPARALGIQPGMRAGGIIALAPEALLLERDQHKEQAALNAIVMAMLRYTPDIMLAPDFGVVLDVGASLTLFGGPVKLARAARESLRAMGFSGTLGAAPTAAGAWLLARRPRQKHLPLRRRCLRTDSLARALDTVPCALLPAAQPYTQWLSGVGAKDLGALRRLPRSGLVRRTSTQLTEALDLAYGDRPELFRWITIPATFSAHIETHERIEHADALLSGATGLILQMTGWLSAMQRAVSIFVLLLEHERGRAAIPPTPLEIALAEPAWKADHLLRLLRERLGKLELSAPVIGLRLSTLHLVAMEAPTESLFPEPGGSPADVLRLMELLTARLGPDNVLAPIPSADHRPEVCNAWGPATERLRKVGDEVEDVARPFWLLTQPIKLLIRDERPFYGSPLMLIRGPERIEAGWWNDQTAARDYYIAQGSDASCFWIYRERTGAMHWYLHGLFA